jgi:hypothetical protein
VLRITLPVRRLRELHNAAEIHDHDPIAHLLNEGQVVTLVPAELVRIPVDVLRPKARFPKEVGHPLTPVPPSQSVHFRGGPKHCPKRYPRIQRAERILKDNQRRQVHPSVPYRVATRCSAVSSSSDRYAPTLHVPRNALSISLVTAAAT